MDGQPRILVVEDDRLLRMDLALVLGREGFELDEACSAKEAFDLLEHHCYAIVLTDVKLPDRSGFEVLDAAKRSDPATKVVLVSCSHAVSSVGDADLHGAETMILKPFALAELLATVRRVMSSGPSHAAPKHPGA